MTILNYSLLKNIKHVFRVVGLYMSGQIFIYIYIQRHREREREKEEDTKTLEYHGNP